MTSREVAVLVTLVVYKVTLIAIAFLAQRRTKDGEDYFLGGRGLSPVVAAVSASASSSSAWTLLGVSGLAYGSGLAALWLFPACVGGFCLNWFVLAPALQRSSRASGALTVTEVFAAGHAPRARRAVSWLASAIVLVSLLTYVASQFQGAGDSFESTFGLARTPSILIGTAIIVFYTMLGGFWAVSLTDTLQGLVMAATAIVLPAVALVAVGPGQLVEALEGVGVEGYTNLFGPRAVWPAGIGFALGLLGIGLGYPGQPHVVNRFMALRGGEAEMRRARAVAIGWAVVVYSGMILLGLCGRILYPSLARGEAVFLTAANDLFHPVLAGIMVAAVLSAVMSTADSQLLVAGSTVTYDLGLGGRHASSMLWRSRLVVLVLSLGAVVSALVWDETIFKKVLFAWSSMGCAFGPLLLVTVLRGPVTARATLVSMSLGFVMSVAAFSSKSRLGSFSGALERVAPFVVALAVAWAGSRPGQRDQPG